MRLGFHESGAAALADAKRRLDELDERETELQQVVLEATLCPAEMCAWVALAGRIQLGAAGRYKVHPFADLWPPTPAAPLSLPRSCRASWSSGRRRWTARLTSWRRCARERWSFRCVGVALK